MGAHLSLPPQPSFETHAFGVLLRTRSESAARSGSRQDPDPHGEERRSRRVSNHEAPETGLLHSHQCRSTDTSQNVSAETSAEAGIVKIQA